MSGHHHHHHGACSHTDKTGYKLFLAIVFNLALSLVQVVGGVLSGSLALVADALHNFSDVGSLIIAYFAQKIAKKPADKVMTYGYGRAEIIGALINSTSLVIVGVYLVYEAVVRFFNPVPIDGWIVVYVAGLALFVDLVTVFLTYEGSKTSVNMRAAYVHNLSDALASVAVIFSGVAVILFKSYWVDFVATILISLYMFYHSYGLTLSCIRTLMQAVPYEIDTDEVKKSLIAISGVVDVSRMHIWEVHEKKRNFEAQIKTDLTNLNELDAVKKKIREVLFEDFKVHSATLDFEVSEGSLTSKGS